MNRPTPALVTQRAAQRLPRAALWMLCAAYAVPGLFGRDPWRTADLANFGVMAAMAEGRTSWLTPTLGEVAVSINYPTHWLGAAFIAALSPLGITATAAARVPFALLLLITMVCTWYATYQLARTEAAQPLAFAFGGEADAKPYARSLADGAVLALVSGLGLLQLGHETTPEVVKLASLSLLLWATAACEQRPWIASLAAPAGMVLLASAGAPWVMGTAGLSAAVVTLASASRLARRFGLWMVALTACGLVGLWSVGQLPAMPSLHTAPRELSSWLRQLLWFLWPLWPLALWTLWQWRRQWNRRHVALPGLFMLVGVIGSLLMGVSDRMLLLALPAIAVLAAFALPTLKRSTGAAIDWFSVLTFSACALTLWVIFLSLHTGVPAQPAINIERLAPGYEAPFQAGAVGVALIATVSWLVLVRWRTGRHQHALWKSLVLPAGGVALNWLLLMTLTGHLLNHAQSLTPWVERLEPHLQTVRCVAAPGLPEAYVAALEYRGRWLVDARPEAAARSGCDALLVLENRNRPSNQPAVLAAQWEQVATVRRPTDRRETTTVFKPRAPAQPE